MGKPGPRAASMEAYAAIRASGVLAAEQKRCYSILYDHGPLTAEALAAWERRPGSGDATLRKRLSELTSMGLVEPVGYATSTAGMKVSRWDVTDKGPPDARPRRHKSALVISRQRVRELQTRVADLEAQVFAKSNYIKELERDLASRGGFQKPLF